MYFVLDSLQILWWVTTSVAGIAFIALIVLVLRGDVTVITEGKDHE